VELWDTHARTHAGTVTHVTVMCSLYAVPDTAHSPAEPACTWECECYANRKQTDIKPNPETALSPDELN